METMPSKFFSGTVCVNHSYIVHVLQYFIQSPVIYLYFTINAGRVLRVMSARWRYCDDVGMFVLKCKFPDIAKAKL